MGYNGNRLGYLKCAGCTYRDHASEFVDGICPRCGYEGQIPVDKDE